MALHGTEAGARRTVWRRARRRARETQRSEPGVRLHSHAVSESGGGLASPGPSNTGHGHPGPNNPGWFNDPAGRFEYRYHNGAVWTSDVASNGQRYVDPVAPGGGPPIPRSVPPDHLGAANGSTSRNGIAVAAMVCGIVSVVLGWIPVLFAVGAVLAVLAIIFGIVGLRRARTSGRRTGSRDRWSRDRCGRRADRGRRPRVHDRRGPRDRPLREPT